MATVFVLAARSLARGQGAVLLPAEMCVEPLTLGLHLLDHSTACGKLRIVAVRDMAVLGVPGHGEHLFGL